MHDAEFYISKINEVHSQYINQGRQKLNSINDKKPLKKQINSEIDQVHARIAQLSNQMQKLESDIALKERVLGKVDDKLFIRRNKSIREKFSGPMILPDQTSISKLNIIKGRYY